MSSRGFFVGKIIDDLDAIASQVRQRCKLQQFDLNTVLENFFRDLLNLVYSLNLQNLNADRVNAPGLDLGDRAPGARIAYQVTSQANSSKINDTLAKITEQDAKDFDEFRVLIIGERQGTYKLDTALAEKRGFKLEHIVDITDLCRDIINLPLTQLQAVQRMLAEEQRRIVIELEPQLPDGSFKTDVLQFIEGRPSVVRSDASAFQGHPELAGLFGSRIDAQEALDGFIDELARLPRSTRSLLGWLVDNADRTCGVGAVGLELEIDFVNRMCTNMPDFAAEMRLLTTRNFIDVEDLQNGQSPRVRVFFPGAGGSDFKEGFIYFRDAVGLTSKTIFATMNFSPFGPPPDAKSSGRKVGVPGAVQAAKLIMPKGASKRNRRAKVTKGP